MDSKRGLLTRTASTITFDQSGIIGQLPFPSPLKDLVRDYCCGHTLYWRHWYHDVLCGIYERHQPDDTVRSYFLRTGTTTSRLYDERKGEENVTPSVTAEDLVRWEQHRPLKNMIYELLTYILPEGVYDATDETNPMLQLIYQYTGWMYGFRLAQTCSQIRVVSIEHQENALDVMRPDSPPSSSYIPPPLSYYSDVLTHLFWCNSFNK